MTGFQLTKNHLVGFLPFAILLSLILVPSYFFAKGEGEMAIGMLVIFWTSTSSYCPISEYFYAGVHKLFLS